MVDFSLEEFTRYERLLQSRCRSSAPATAAASSAPKPVQYSNMGLFMRTQPHDLEG